MADSDDGSELGNPTLGEGNADPAVKHRLRECINLCRFGVDAQKIADKVEYGFLVGRDVNDRVVLYQKALLEGVALRDQMLEDFLDRWKSPWRNFQDISRSQLRNYCGSRGLDRDRGVE